MNQVKPKFKLKSEHIIMNPEKTMCIGRQEALTIEGYRQMTWEEFKDIYELQMLAGKPKFWFGHIKQAKKILEGMGLSLEDCVFHYTEGFPLVIDTDEGWFIAISIKLE